ncbi:glycoside hydrolase family 65 protein [Carnobacterium gallinarum]|uniref:glycoside hydrolase family 65 protein n=1 Tax=Carnobacterium gallinarum TaxID=2749 RepID=UPI00069038C4|nr:glycosyl hydrolase family 65 protein [Carnobacterium gallinarum]
MGLKGLKNASQLVETNLEQEKLAFHNTLFSLSNGHLGVRGNLEEGYFSKNHTGIMGTYVNGFYETSPIVYGENAYGYAKNHQTICKLPNGHILTFEIEGERFQLDLGTVDNHQRTLDLFEGILKREFQWTSSTGKKVVISTERFVSYQVSEALLLSYELTPLNFSGEIVLIHDLLEEELETVTAIDDPRIAARHEKQTKIEAMKEADLELLQISTIRSGLRLWTTATVKPVAGEVLAVKGTHSNQKLETAVTFAAVENEPIKIEVIVGYSEIVRDSEAEKNVKITFMQKMHQVSKQGFKQMKNQHLADMADFWSISDVEIAGDDELQLGLRLNLFHLNQAAGRDGKTNIAAKGLTGDGYEGHYFWDTEMYMLPFFVYTNPATAYQLLSYRHSILESARKRAREMGVAKGALFAWRTINGEECSAYYPAGTAQFHINADIAYGVKVYYEATADETFMAEKGLAILVETARFWREFGDYISGKEDQFCLNGVTGPDEYTAIVNNNYYTNLMAKYNLQMAAKMATRFQATALFKELGVTDSEIASWQEAGDNMYLPYDEDRQLTKQDDSFFDKAVWDFAGTPKENYPLLLNYHPLTIYRYQVNKQADTVLAQLLYGEATSKEQKQRDFDYYEQVTTHDSSLSRSIFGMMASEIGEEDKAYHYFMDTALMDLVDMQENTADGIHAANMGGTWMSLVYGFAGMKVSEGHLSFAPRLPKKWDALSFSIEFQGQIVKVTLSHDGSKYELVKGTGLTISENGHLQKLI